MDLFQAGKPAYEPLASRMRPRNLDEYSGQEHIIGPGKLLRRAIAADQLSSLIFYGPPGTGKTTLAQVIAATTKSHFLSLNAVLSGVKDIREIIEKSQDLRRLYGKKTILFVDEVHRWNKAQQDALLPWVENGTFILVGATTENPYFEVNSALVSRSRVFQLRALTDADLLGIALATLADEKRGYGRFVVRFEAGALEHLVKIASGDARSLLNALELAVESSVSPFPPAPGSEIVVTLEDAEQSIQKKVVLYDKDGDYHFDTISAFIKSLRGSDPDAALYWLARMVRAGEDPQYIFRRMLVSAGEDIGLADPQALVVVTAAAEAFHRVGLPEGQFHLAQAALYLAAAPKSNSTLGYFEALKSIDEQSDGEIPSPLKDASRDGKAFGHGQGYLYPHAFKDHWVAQQYLPRGLREKIFYKPGSLGWEGDRRDLLLSRREALLAAQSDVEPTEVLTFSPEPTAGWKKRLERSAGGLWDELRTRIFHLLDGPRHSVFWAASDAGGLILFEALRRFREGLVAASLPDRKEALAVNDYLAFLPDLEKPLLWDFSWDELDQGTLSRAGLSRFDRVAGIWKKIAPAELPRVLAKLAAVLAPNGRAVLALSLPADGQRLLSLLPENPSERSSDGARKLPEAELAPLREAEEAFFRARRDQDLSLDALTGLGLSPELFTGFEEVFLTRRQLETWLDPARTGGLGESLAHVWSQGLSREVLVGALADRTVSWKRAFALVTIDPAASQAAKG